MHQGLEDVPALLSGGGDDGTHSGEVVGTPLGAEATGDLLAQLGHSEVTFGLIVRKRRARVPRRKSTNQIGFSRISSAVVQSD